MVQAANYIPIEPGRQLPQSVVVNSKRDGSGDAQTIRYMLFVPQAYKADGQKWPLMLFLHGLGESSDDDLSLVKVHGPAKIVESRPDFPFVVVTPQLPPPPGQLKDAPTAWRPEPLIQLVDHVIKNMNVDPKRVYCSGLSMGGWGTFRLVAAYPERFAAAVPICGGGEPKTMARSLRRVPIWAFHGALDKVFPVSTSQEMVDAIQRAGGNARLTVYPDVGHNSWAPTYENEEVYKWLLSHRRPL